MRVLFINANRSAAYGGVERWMIDTASGLGARGHACTLFGRPGTAWLRAAAAAGVPVIDDIRGAWIARVFGVRRVMRQLRPDVVIAKAKKAARMAMLASRFNTMLSIPMLYGMVSAHLPQAW